MWRCQMIVNITEQLNKALLQVVLARKLGVDGLAAKHLQRVRNLAKMAGYRFVDRDGKFKRVMGKGGK
jgi:hypothetical protein